MALLKVARLKNYARSLKIKTISELPAAIDIYLLPEAKLPVNGLLLLDKYFKRAMKRLSAQNGYRFILNDKYKKDIASFVTRIMMLASGEEAAVKTGKS